MAICPPPVRGLSRPAFTALAIAPFALLLALPITTLTNLSLLGSSLVIFPLLIPLALLSFAPDLPPSSRTTLRLALALFLLLLPATALHLAPRYLLNPDRSPAGISLRPTRYETPIPNAVDILGLSTRDEPMIEHWSPADRVPWTFRVKLWINSNSPPCRLDDGQGNSINCSLPAANTILFTDSRGGSATLTWTGTQFTLASSTPATQSPSARGPTPLALSLKKTGDYLLTLTPFLACLVLTRFAHQRARAAGLPTTLPLAAILQLLGIVNLTWFLLLWQPPSYGGETNVIYFLVAALVSLATFGPAFALLAHSLLRKPTPTN